MVSFASVKIFIMDSLETELQKMYDSKIHVDIGWLWDGGIDVSIGDDEVTGNVRTVAEILPWLQKEIATHYPDAGTASNVSAGNGNPFGLIRRSDSR